MRRIYHINLGDILFPSQIASTFSAHTASIFFRVSSNRTHLLSSMHLNNQFAEALWRVSSHTFLKSVESVCETLRLALALPSLLILVKILFFRTS